jgi:hypothetical protein
MIFRNYVIKCFLAVSSECIQHNDQHQLILQLRTKSSALSIEANCDADQRPLSHQCREVQPSYKVPDAYMTLGYLKLNLFIRQPLVAINLMLQYILRWFATSNHKPKKK